MPRDNRIGIVTLPAELYHYLCDTSFERAMKGSVEDRHEFKERMLQLELAFRNTAWELEENSNGPGQVQKI